MEPEKIISSVSVMDSNPNRFILSKLPTTNERIRFHDYMRNVSMNGIWFCFVFGSQHKSLSPLETKVEGVVAHFIHLQIPPKWAS